MEMTLRTRRYAGDLIIKDGNATLEIDPISNGEADWEIIERFISVALELFEFNKRTRNDFVMKFVKDYMTSDDVERLIDSLNKEYASH